MSNIIAPNNGSEIALQEKIFKWDFQKSVEKTAPKIAKWKALTVDIARELYLAREYLNNQTGQRKDPSAPDYIRFTWNDYCEHIGVPRSTANNWLRAFVPAELSDDGENKLYSAEELRQLNAANGPAEAAAQEERIASFLKTGKRPDGWTRADEKELSNRMAAKRAKEVAAVWCGRRLKVQPRRDFFAEIMEHGEDLRKFRLETAEQTDLQMQTFDAIDDYLRSFSTMTSRLQAAYNLSIKLKDTVNYYAELDLQASQARASALEAKAVAE